MNSIKPPFRSGQYKVIAMDTANRQKFTEVIFKNIRDGIVILDRDFRILAANESVLHFSEKRF